MPSFTGLTDLIQRKIQSKTIILLVGLPGSGKSTICHQLSGFLNAQGYSSLVYNAGNIRRAMSSGFSDSEFFNPDNAEASQKREKYATMCMQNMLEDLKENRVNVGFLDATNSTTVRRHSMLKLIQKADVEISNIFVLDVSCTEKRLVNYNITSKAFNQDYRGKDIATSISDFKKRSEHYDRIFEPILSQEFVEFRNVKHFSIQNGGRTFVVPQDASDDDSCDVTLLLAAFVTNYYKTYGESYHAAVDEFYSCALGGI
ncbi:6PF2K-domain-containing protein [Metschnikowia bicuspidata var. bicuspidata NRRL YB-4993]|uniref:6PF2K-domain-containing protein n=1 Tax=Metschnikowia bicuspidata var. bicuspidata NRRL YB-4993 TaxID=869754 RepID=A0A1A0H7W3_9ASCO|nr:6PF2K-domain-containing protein [Metschnikowia bicuspidata var. bicuspidata NRRL YB-4993]OBA19982.1 6PF2K-domain-containing protein [Metschnikowia bicuspidata var. bicuspidata NRRL YB-4993]